MPQDGSLESTITKLIVSMFDAAPGKSVLTELRGVLESGESLANLTRNLANTDVFRSLYPSTLNLQEFAERFSQRALRDEVGSAQLRYATQELTALQHTGMSRDEVIAFAAKALLAVDPADADWGGARRAFENKIVVADYFSMVRGKSAHTLEELQRVLYCVNSNSDSRESAIRAIDGLPPLNPPRITGLEDAVVKENTPFNVRAGVAGATGRVSWSLKGNDSALFRIDPDTGALHMTARDYELPADYDGDNIYHITVRMIDDCGHVAMQAVTVTVTNVAESVTLTISIAENSAFKASAAVAGLNGTTTWVLEGPDASRFSINPISGELTMVARDYEAPADADGDNLYNVTVKATDAAGNVASQVLAVSVTNVIERATPGISGPGDSSIAENTHFSGMAVVVGAIGAVTWTLEGADARSFTLNRTSGALTMAARDFELPVDMDGNNVYNVTIRATDSDGNTATQDVAVTVSNRNEAPTSLSLSVSRVDENIAASSAVATLSSRDPDTGDTFSYSLVSGAGDSDNAWFSISGTQLRIEHSPDFEARPDYSLRIRSTDQGGLSIDQVARLSVNDQIAAPFGLRLDAADDSGMFSDDGRTRHTSALTITGHADRGATVEVLVGEGAELVSLGSTRAHASTGVFTLDVNLNAGTHRITARERDVAGNASPAANPFELVVDTSVPHVTLDPFGMHDVINASSVLPILFGDVEEGASLVLSLGSNSHRPDNIMGGWDYPLHADDLAAMGQGMVAITITATDAAGNDASASRLLLIDTLAPAAPSALGLAADDDTGLHDNDSITRRTEELTITAITEADAAVELVINGVSQGTTPASAAGSFSRTLNLPEGHYAIATRATDTAGNAGALSAAWLLQVDTTRPQAPSLDPIAGNDILDAGEQASTLTGTAEAKTLVTLVLGGGNERTVLVGDDGLWSHALQPEDITALSRDAVPDGAFPGQGNVTITAMSTDLAGNRSSTVTSRVVRLDTLTPIIFPIAEDNIINASEQGSVIAGAGEANAVVHLTLGQFRVGGVLENNVHSFAANADGRWSYTLQSADITAMGQGEETIALSTVGAAGNGRTSRDISIDTEKPPAPGFDTVADDNVVTATETATTLSGTAESGTTVALRLGGTTRWVTAEGNRWHYALQPEDLAALGEGIQIISATASDRAGNVGTTSLHSVTIDTLIPAAPAGLRLATEDDSGRYNNDGITRHHAALTVSGAAEAGTTVTLFADHDRISSVTADGSGVFTFEIALPHGQYAISALATDAAGNVSPVSTAMLLRVDTEPPVPPASLVLAVEDNGSGNPATLQSISGTSEAGTLVELFLGEGAGATALGSAMADPDTGVFSINLTQPAGTHTFSARATDTAGNTSTGTALTYQPASLTIASPRGAIAENTALADDASVVVASAALVVPSGDAAPGIVTWRLQPAGTTNDTDRFVLNPASGEVRLKPQDREDQDPSADDHYTVRLVATDSARPAQTLARVLEVVVTNEHEVRWLEIDEVPSDGIPLVLLVELDEGTSATIPLIVKGDPQGKLEWISLEHKSWNNVSPASYDESTRQLTITAPSYEESVNWAPQNGLLDGDMAIAYYLIQDSEEAGPNLTLYAIAVRSRDVVEPREFSITHLQQVYTVEEGKPLQQTILSIAQSQSLEVAGGLLPIGQLSWRASSLSPALSVSVNESGAIVLHANPDLDREALVDLDGNSTVTATVRATDEDGNFAEHVVTIEIADKPEPTQLEIQLPPALQGPGPHAVDENSPHEFQLTGGAAPGHPPMQGRPLWSLSAIDGHSIDGFSIDQTGRLTLARQDYEALSADNKTRTVKIILRDQDGNPNSVSADISLRINDLADTAQPRAMSFAFALTAESETIWASPAAMAECASLQDSFAECTDWAALDSLAAGEAEPGALTNMPWVAWGDGLFL